MSSERRGSRRLPRLPRPPQMPRRPSERVVGAFFRGATRVTGMRPALVPAHMRRQLQVIGVDDRTLARVLANVKALADWPYAWEAEGDRRGADRDWLAAAAAYYVGQRVLLTDSPLKRRLYSLVRNAYEQVDHTAPLEQIRVPWQHGEIAAYLQVPTARRGRQRDGRVPLVVMVPGITATKEEFHPFAEPLLQRGYAVARLDNPGYGETVGAMAAGAEHNPARLVDALLADPRIDPDDVHLLGMSQGGYWALHSAHVAPVQSVVVISAPFAPHRYLLDLPSMNVTALQHMTQLPDYESIVAFSRTLTLEHVASEIRMPVKAFHGGRDRTIPVEEAYELADNVGGPVAVTVWPRDHHNCLEHFDEMIVETLEWLDDPQPAVRAFQAQQRAERTAQAARRRPANGESAVDPVPGAEPGLA